MKTLKRISALALALVMALALSACGGPKAPAIPDPAATTDAYLAYILHNDPAKLQTLYGYATSADAIAEQAKGLTVYDSLKDSLLDGLSGDEATPNEQSLSKLTGSIMDLLARVPYSCTLVSQDNEAGTAVVSVTVDTLPADAFGDAMSEYATPILMQNLDKLTDKQAVLDLTLDILTDYIDQLQPTGQTAALDVTLTLLTGTVNGREQPYWDADDAAQVFGSDIMTAILGAELFG
ncbi:MAG: hypothetical protein IJP02_03550 [Oscillospiraceae bacterium]|nr:hypothetical protein [Oscillospiraceae bacterium]